MTENEMSMSEASGKKELEPTQQEHLPQLSGSKDLHTILRNAELQVEAQSRITKMALRMTSISDWKDMGGKPYLEYEGACKIARLFGVSVRNVMSERQELKDDKGSYYMYTFSGEAEWNGVVTPEIGSCTSRDRFFGQKNGVLLPESEVTVSHVMAKAHTNLMNRAIKHKLGLRFTWEEIAEATDGRITKNQGGTVYYDKGSKGGSTAPTHDDPEANNKRREIREWILEFVGGDAGQAQETLENLTKFKNKDDKWVGGRRNIKDVSDKAVNILYPKVKAEIEAYRKGGLVE